MLVNLDEIAVRVIFEILLIAERVRDDGLPINEVFVGGAEYIGCGLEALQGIIGIRGE